jgi:conjugative relaxase-like TrwC/TraI family protein
MLSLSVATMIFITPCTSAQETKDYFNSHLAPSDYYTKDMAETPGQWHGLGAELLGLKGQVSQQDFFALCDNTNPQTGERLTPRTKAERNAAYDFTFDAPKSVSLAYAVGKDERLLGAFQTAAHDTLDEMEASVKTRVRTKGADENRLASNMVRAEFVHRTSRPVDGVPDPQLHMHAVILNATYDSVEKKWKAAQLGDLYRDKATYQAEFHSRLAANLRALGYGTEKDGNSFRLSGIGKDLTDRFSRRTEIIEAEAERLGVTSAKTKGELGRRTREKKDHTPKSMENLRAAWNTRLSDAEREQIVDARNGKDSDSIDARQAVDYALAHSFERASAVPEKELMKTALIQSVGSASVADVREAFRRDDIIARDRDGVTYATTKDVLKEELSMTAFVRDGRGRFAKLGGTSKTVLDKALSKEQRDAALIILGSRDRVTGLKGGAGTGKTRMMQSTVAAIERSGSKVFTFAPSAEASRGVLRSEGFTNAETVERLLIDPEMQKAVKNQVLWVDEAGLLSSRDMKRLFDVSEQQNARLILSGDTAQHSAVVRGDALRILERNAGMKTAELKEVRRQTNDSYREAVKAISQGDWIGKDGKSQLEAGIGILDNMGAIVATSGDDRYRQIAADYASVTKERKADGTIKSVLVVSPTHAQAGQVTNEIRAALKREGRIGETDREFTALRPLNLTEAQRGDVREYQPGLVIQFHQNAKGFTRGEKVTVAGADGSGVRALRADGAVDIVPYRDAKRFQLYKPEAVCFTKGDRIRITQNGFTKDTRRGLLGNKKQRLNNGSVYEVDGFTKQGDIRLGNGSVVPKDYGGITSGYVITSHASQGRTTDAVLIAMGRDSLAAANREQFYVSVSRAREKVKIYTDDREAMMSAVKESGARLSATELMESKPASAKPRVSIMRRLFRNQQVQRAFWAVRERLAAARVITTHREPTHASIVR